MGSLSSKPKAPVVVQQPIIAPPPAATPPVEATSPDDAGTSASAQLREGNLLRRARGQLGTINTSFLGLGSRNTNASNTANSRKTLLGE